MSEIVPARVATESNGAFCIGCSNATNGQIPWQVFAYYENDFDPLFIIQHVTPTLAASDIAIAGA